MPSTQVNLGAVKKIFTDGNVTKEVYFNGNIVFRDSVLPAGIIIATEDTVAPSGWDLFTAANGKMVIGTSIPNIGTSGGSNSVSWALTTNTGGAHSGGTFTLLNSGFYYTSAVTGSSTGTQGGHSHTITVSGTWNPYRHGIRLIKSNTEHQTIPVGGIVFSAVDLTGTIDGTNVLTENAYLYPSVSESGLQGSTTIALAGTSNTTGAHNHINPVNNYLYAGGSSYGYSTGQGNHSHTVSIDVTPDMYEVILAAWRNASVEMALVSNIIGMWDSATIPDGWALCDGTQGTPDLVGYFVKFGTDAQAGTSHAGGNTYVPATALSTSGGHQHLNTLFALAGSAAYHNNTITHSHNTVAEYDNFVPSYYALAFIMKL